MVGSGDRLEPTLPGIETRADGALDSDAEARKTGQLKLCHRSTGQYLDSSQVGASETARGLDPEASVFVSEHRDHPGQRTARSDAEPDGAGPVVNLRRPRESGGRCMKHGRRCEGSIPAPRSGAE